MKGSLLAILSALPTGLSGLMRGSSRELSMESYLEEAAEIYTPTEDFLSRSLSETCPGMAYFNVDVSFSYTLQPADLGCVLDDYHAMATAIQIGVNETSGNVKDKTYKEKVDVLVNMCEDLKYVGCGKYNLSEVEILAKETTMITTTTTTMENNNFRQRERRLCSGCWPYNGGGGGGCSDCGNNNCDDDTNADDGCRRRELNEELSADFDDRLKPELEKRIYQEIRKALHNVPCLSSDNAVLAEMNVTVYQKLQSEISDGCSGYADAYTTITT